MKMSNAIVYVSGKVFEVGQVPLGAVGSQIPLQRWPRMRVGRDHKVPALLDLSAAPVLGGVCTHHRTPVAQELGTVSRSTTWLPSTPVNDHSSRNSDVRRAGSRHPSQKASSRSARRDPPLPPRESPSNEEPDRDQEPREKEAVMGSGEHVRNGQGRDDGDHDGEEHPRPRPPSPMALLQGRPEGREIREKPSEVLSSAGTEGPTRPLVELGHVQAPSRKVLTQVLRHCASLEVRHAYVGHVGRLPRARPMSTVRSGVIGPPPVLRGVPPGPAPRAAAASPLNRVD